MSSPEQHSTDAREVGAASVEYSLCLFAVVFVAFVSVTVMGQRVHLMLNRLGDNVSKIKHHDPFDDRTRVNGGMPETNEKQKLPESPEDNGGSPMKKE